ncbi:MAG: outer membrane beta-barrel protein [Phormidesmis sp. FL-bin-119]|nr:outer membrane beta-barrel protein [Pedobacter sp.]
MKRLLLSALVIFLTAPGFAQDKKKDTVLVITADTLKNTNKKTITIRIGTGDKDTTEQKIKPSSKFSFQFVASRIDLGLSTYTDNGSFTLSPANSYLERETWKSSNFGFEFFQMGYRFNSYFKTYVGAGLDWNHIRLKQNITFQKDKPTLTYATEKIDYKKNRFSSQYLRIPLSFQLRTKDDKKGNKLNFVFGPEVGFLLNGKIKQVSKENGKDKSKDDYNFNPFRYGGFARLGYGGTGVYVKYYGNDVFADGQGPKDFKNLAFGLMLGF